MKNLQKYGGTSKRFIFKPKWARWKMFIRFSDQKAAVYYSYDYNNVFVNGTKTKAYRERLALIDMIARLREKHPGGYKYANVFANLSEDLSTDKKNYNYLVFSMTPDKCTWKQELFYQEKNVPGSAYISVRVDTNKTLNSWQYKDEQSPQVTAAAARAEVYRVLGK